MRVAVLVFMCTILMRVFADPYVTNVVAKTRMPWNGLVDVSYEIVGSTNGLECVYGQLTATDRTRGKTYVASTFEKNIDLAEGKHTAIWNMAADSSFTSKDVVFNMSIRVPALYCVIDLSGGPDATSYPVSELDDVPAGGWTDEYKSTKLVMRRCPAGADPLGRYTLTKAFYAGVFEVTQKQWELVVGDNPTSTMTGGNKIGDLYPVNTITYDSIRGSGLGSMWPTSTGVDSNSFCGKIRDKAGISIDLPTEAQWEYACRAGATTKYNLGNDESDLGRSGWYDGNANNGLHTVGMKEANAWGLYDTHGNVWEMCLDWNGATLSGNDPVGMSEGQERIRRGGGWLNTKSEVLESRCVSPTQKDFLLGFRVFVTLP